jgi:mannose-6-phosphate isomerase-like protein (cupin superfamily)
MPRSGDRFEMPDGSVYEVTKGPSETGGELVEMEFTLPPGSVAPPPHVHAELAEDYEVLEGTFDVMVDGRWTKLGPGQSATVPAGALHTFKNRTDGVVRVRNVHRPPARFDQYIEHIHRLAHARGIRGAKDPRLPIYLSMVMLEYPETLAPGRARERVMLKTFAGIGRLLRFRTAV